MSSFMKFTFLFIMFFAMLNRCNPQNIDTLKFEQINLKKYYDNKGVIIPRNYNKLPMFTNFVKERFTPTIEEIEQGENILSHLVNMILGNSNEGKMTANQKLRLCYRQYVGIVNNNDEKVLVILMLDASSIEAQSLLEQWEYEPVSSLNLNEYYRVFHINLKTSTLDEHSNPLLDCPWFL